MASHPTVIPSSTKPDQFGHPFVRFVAGPGGKPGHWIESAVYNVRTGAKHLCWPVDARELVRTGEWAYDPPQTPPEACTAPPEPVAEVAPAPASKSRRAARSA